jgi:hypothetical protein
MNAPDTGLRLLGEARAGRAGLWWRATTAGGDGRGVLLLDPSAVAVPGVIDRVVSTVVAIRDRPGVLPIADLVTDAGRTWLITAPATPILAELLAAPDLDPAAALAVAAGTGGALAGLHRAGLGHGAFGADTVVVDPAGTVSLIEVGLVPALWGTAVPPAADGAAWAALARTLAGRLAGGPVADLLHHCAGLAESTGPAESPGLERALRALDSGAASLGLGVARREWLMAAAAAAAGRPTGGTAPAPAPDAGARTLLPLPAAGPDRGPDAGPDGRAGDDPADALTRLGRRAAASGLRAAPPGRAGLRFGPGVDAAGRAPAWRAGGSRRRRRRRDRLRALASGLLTLAVLAGVGGYLWWQRQNPLQVTAVVVAPAQPPGEECDVTVDVVGTVQTNGRGGTVTYQWIRSDGEMSAVLDQTVPDGSASTQVHLFWAFSGQGRYQAVATLKVLAPTPMQASGEFTYACG